MQYLCKLYREWYNTLKIVFLYRCDSKFVRPGYCNDWTHVNLFVNLSIHETTILPDFEEGLEDIEVYYQVSKYVFKCFNCKIIETRATSKSIEIKVVGRRSHLSATAADIVL